MFIVFSLFCSKLTVHAQRFLVPLPATGRLAGGVFRGLGLLLHSPVARAAGADAVRPHGPGGAGRLLRPLAGGQARLVQALLAVLGLQAPQAHLILPFRSQRTHLLGIHCENRNILRRGRISCLVWMPCCEKIVMQHIWVSYYLSRRLSPTNMVKDGQQCDYLSCQFCSSVSGRNEIVLMWSCLIWFLSWVLLYAFAWFDVRIRIKTSLHTQHATYMLMQINWTVKRDCQLILRCELCFLKYFTEL